MFCSECGNEMKNDAKFCSNCGSQLDVPSIGKANDSIVTLTCRTCGGILSGNATNPILNCPFCGSSEMIIESDNVKIQRIRSEEHVSIAKNTSDNKRAMQLDRFNYEELKRNTLSIKGKIMLAMGIASIIAIIILGIITSHTKSFWTGYMIFAIIMGWVWVGLAHVCKDDAKK